MLNNAFCNLYSNYHGIHRGWPPRSGSLTFLQQFALRKEKKHTFPHSVFVAYIMSTIPFCIKFHRCYRWLNLNFVSPSLHFTQQFTMEKTIAEHHCLQLWPTEDLMNHLRVLEKKRAWKEFGERLLFWSEVWKTWRRRRLLMDQNHKTVDAIESVASECYKRKISKDVAIIAGEREREREDFEDRRWAILLECLLHLHMSVKEEVKAAR